MYPFASITLCIDSQSLADWGNVSWSIHNVMMIYSRGYRSISMRLWKSERLLISCNRRPSTARFKYSLVNKPLERVSAIKDLGVFLDPKLLFDQHAMLGFLRRNSQHFDDIYALRSLHSALVRSVLEYGAQVRAPYHPVYPKRIKRAQKRFIR